MRKKHKENIPPPPELPGGPIKKRKDISKHTLNEFDKLWLSNRKKELHKIKHKSFFSHLMPSFNRKESKIIHDHHSDKVKDLLDKRKEKLNLLKKELNNWKSRKHLTKIEKKQIKLNEQKIKEIEKNNDFYHQILKNKNVESAKSKRDIEIHKERSKRESKIKHERRHQEHLIKLHDKHKDKKLKEYRNNLKIQVLDTKRKKEIKKLILNMIIITNQIQKLSDRVDVSRLSSHKIQKYRKQFLPKEEFNIHYHDLKKKVNEYKDLAIHKKTHLALDISDLSTQFKTYSHMTKSLRSHIIEKLNHLEQLNKDEIKEIQLNNKKAHHEKLMKERKRELELLEKKKQKLHQAEIKKEKLKLKFGLKPKKFHHIFEIEDAVKEQKDIEIETSQKDWTEEFASHKISNREKQKLDSTIKKAKKLEWEVDLEYKDWLKSFLKHKIPKKHSKRLPKKFNLNIDLPIPDTEGLFPKSTSPIQAPKVDVEKDWLDSVKAVKPRILKKQEDPSRYKKYEDKLSYIAHMIHLARDSLMKFDMKKAKEIYVDIMVVYNRLEGHDKSKVYENIKELYEERKDAERLLGS